MMPIYYRYTGTSGGGGAPDHARSMISTIVPGCANGRMIHAPINTAGDDCTEKLYKKNQRRLERYELYKNKGRKDNSPGYPKLQ